VAGTRAAAVVAQAVHICVCVQDVCHIVKELVAFSHDSFELIGLAEYIWIIVINLIISKEITCKSVIVDK